MAITTTASATISDFAAGLAAGSLALFGVTYHGLLWALFGALVSLLFTSPQTRPAASAAVIGGMLSGAVLSDLVLLLLVTTLPSLPASIATSIHLAMAFVVGAGAKPILTALVSTIIRKLKKYGGDDHV